MPTCRVRQQENELWQCITVRGGHTSALTAPCSEIASSCAIASGMPTCIHISCCDLPEILSQGRRDDCRHCGHHTQQPNRPQLHRHHRNTHLRVSHAALCNRLRPSRQDPASHPEPTITSGCTSIVGLPAYIMQMGCRSKCAVKVLEAVRMQEQGKAGALECAIAPRTAVRIHNQETI